MLWGWYQSAKVCGAGNGVEMASLLNVEPFTILKSGYTIDAPQLEMALQTIKYSKLFRDFIAAWKTREDAWSSYINDETNHSTYSYYNGMYNGLRQALINIYGWDSFIDILRVYEDKNDVEIK